jgi:putative copper resistance protein D
MQGFADFVDNLLRGGILLALSLALGSVVWGLYVLRAPTARLVEAPLVRWCVTLLVAGAAALALSETGSLAIRAAALLRDLGSGAERALLATLPFRAGLVRVTLALGLATAALWLSRAPASPTRWRVTAASALLVGASGAWLVHGAARLDDRALLMTCTALHQVAAAVWTGGLVQLGVAWRLTRRDPALTDAWPPLVARFSRLAVVCITILLASSSPLVWHYIGSWTGLTGTGYGSILSMKVVLLAAALLLATGNRNALRR